MPFTNKLETISANSWTGLLGIYQEKFQKEKGPQWIFRGEKAENDESLKSSFERAIEGLDGTMARGLDKRPVLELEDALIRRFKRQYHHFETNAPREDDIVEWLALMQHYGAPTRFLDWTYSFFVAVFFAVENAKKKFPCVVWAFDSSDKWLINRIKLLAPNLRKTIDNDHDIRSDKIFRKLFLSKSSKCFVYPLNPYRLNERLIIQQGAFLCPANLTTSFKDNLLETIPDNDTTRLIKIKVKLDIEGKRQILRQLHRMNINRATLFPGLAGFAQSIGTTLAFNEILKPGPEFKVYA